MIIKTIIRKCVALFKIKNVPDPSEYSSTLGIGTVIPCQNEAYFLALNNFVEAGDRVLDVGCGLGYGLNILAIKAKEVIGIDVDPKAYEYCQNFVLNRNPKVKDLILYDGSTLPFPNEYFDVVTSVDVIEHVKTFHEFLDELLRVSKRGVFISTPNRRPEFTNKDGTPKNYWHLREWSYDEFDKIAVKHGEVDWNFLNGPFNGPFTITNTVQEETLTLTPFIRKQK